MNIITLDFETYFDQEYSLDKMTTEEYVRNPRFEAHGVGLAVNGGKAVWCDGKGLDDIPWDDTACLAHHAQFDGLILSHHYGIKPAMWFDTLSMARAVLGPHIPKGLGELAKHFNLGAKNVPYDLFKGKHWGDLDTHTQQAVTSGCCHDVELTWHLFCLLSQGFPASEFALIDETVRLFTEPVLVGAPDVLDRVYREEREAKDRLLAKLGVTTTQLRQNETLIRLLEAEGVEVEWKPGKGKENPCFAKTDQFMRDLVDDENPRVAALAQARLDAASNLTLTRTQRLRGMADRGKLCVYLNYCGAHTKRWSGGDKCLAGDTRVTVFDAQKGLTEKRLVDILLDDLVWDGEDFVAHEGVIFQGYKEVIEYDGVKGTRDHKVYLASGGVSTLEEAKVRGLRLERARKPTSKQVHARRKIPSGLDGYG